MIIDVLTLFPEFFEPFKNWSIIGRAIEREIFELNTLNIRDFSDNKHKKVDDYPFGGGPGMVMTPKPIYDAIKSCKKEGSLVVYLSPQGKRYNQKIANNLAKKDHIILLCGHYEGIDNRIVDNYIDLEISAGDYVLTGGEVPAMMVIESLVRLLPGTLGQEESFTEESHYSGLLEYPQYTRPREFRGHQVPEILLSGNHGKIEEWRSYQALKTTYKKRPDLLEAYDINEKEKFLLEKIKKADK